MPLKLSEYKNKELLYVIQFHRASHDHWDFRLEMNGVLKSWAVPKSPADLKEGKKHLAIQVEDHDLSYGNFEGEIEEGYGKGTVKMWDNGTYVLEDKKQEKIVFELKGKKLKGKYVLLKLKTNYGKTDSKSGKNWLLMKMNN